jgi:DNA-binding NarL/FixJ family response regulator
MNEHSTVLIVDDHRMFREGIRARLTQEPDFRVVGEAASAAEALVTMKRERPSIVILDIRLPETSGVELARRLRREWPEVKILVLSGYDFEQYVRSLARIGIQGYLLKDEGQEALVQALREVARGRAVLPPRIASTVMRTYASDPGRHRLDHVWELTAREIEILEYVREGFRNNDIGLRLGISTRTVESHVSNIIAKLGAGGRIEAVRLALERGILR